MSTIACYCRVSTADQTLDRQREATAEYARSQFDIDLSALKVYTDKSTGTNTARDGYQTLMADIEAGTVDAVIVKSISRIARSIRDLDRTADRIKNADAELHIIDESLTLRPEEDDPYQNALFRLLGVFAELEAEMAQKRTAEGIAVRQQENDYHHGPAPLGFEKDDGQLVESESYHDVVAVLELVQKGELSKRKAAQQLGCARSTIRAALDRNELYEL